MANKFVEHILSGLRFGLHGNRPALLDAYNSPIALAPGGVSLTGFESTITRMVLDSEALLEDTEREVYWDGKANGRGQIREDLGEWRSNSVLEIRRMMKESADKPDVVAAMQKVLEMIRKTEDI